MFDAYLRRWKLVPDGDPVATRSSRLLPVRRGDGGGEPAMLKLALEEDERSGGLLMEWWDGDGAARVLARDGEALLLERAQGAASLSDMARSGRDDEACRVLCAVAARLHAPRPKPPPPDLVPLPRWFRDLEPAAAAHGGILVRCAETARALLDSPREVGVLHGDLHHDNVLDFGPRRGWLAIDPKRLLGERGLDFANIFTNPDLSDPTRPVATLPGRFARRVAVVAEAAGLERDGASPAIDIRIAELAAAELDRR
jgi:streptomycin 6-kinase